MIELLFLIFLSNSLSSTHINLLSLLDALPTSSQSHLLALRCLIGARLGSGGFRYFCRPGFLHLFPRDGLVHLDGGRSEVINTALLAPNAQDPTYGVFDRPSGVVGRGRAARRGSRLPA